MRLGGAELHGAHNSRPGHQVLSNAMKAWNRSCPGGSPNLSVRIVQEFPQLSQAGHDLMSQLLTYDPERRITAAAALRHRWFAEPPFPLDCAAMPQFATLSLDGRNDCRSREGAGCTLLPQPIFDTCLTHHVIVGVPVHVTL